MLMPHTGDHNQGRGVAASAHTTEQIHADVHTNFGTRHEHD